ncbi:MAG TPA: hypothetical protein VLK84_24065 [Longimicrobium sp.]|nr:hypothetical protein [Longimicrobium sp.]
MAGKKVHDLARQSVPPEEQRLEGRGSQPRPSAREARLTRIEQFELRRGPIPDAEELARYRQAHPDAPDIILTEFRNQGAHRRMLEKAEQDREHKNVDAAIASERIGVAAALLIALVGFACATYLVATGHGAEGTIIFGLDVGALVSAFILGRPKAGAQGA